MMKEGKRITASSINRYCGGSFPMLNKLLAFSENMAVIEAHNASLK